MSTYVKVYTNEDTERTSKFIEQSEVMIDIAMSASMKEVKTIVKQWKDDLAEVEDHRRNQQQADE